MAAIVLRNGSEMSSSSQNQQDASRFGGLPPRGSQPQPPNCPACQRQMEAKRVVPVLFASGLDDVLYTCEPCGTEAKRTVKRA
jgi:hypothetical protein